MQKYLKERATDFVYVFFFFVAIMKLLEIFVPREKPLYQDEFSYCRMYLVQTIKQSK